MGLEMLEPLDVAEPIEVALRLGHAIHLRNPRVRPLKKSFPFIVVEMPTTSFPTGIPIILGVNSIRWIGADDIIASFRKASHELYTVALEEFVDARVKRSANSRAESDVFLSFIMPL